MRIFSSLLFLLIFFAACSTSEPEPGTDIEVATQFIYDLHKGDFSAAEKLLLHDQTNDRLLKEYEQYFKTWPADKRDYFRDNDVLIIDEVSPVTDSVSIVSYSTNYQKQEKNKVKAVRSQGRWLVDFKYTFSGNL